MGSYMYGMRNKEKLSHNDQEHLKFFVREFLYPHINFDPECWKFAQKLTGWEMTRIHSWFVLDIIFFKKKFGTTSIPEILWMYIHRRSIGRHSFVTPCSKAKFCVNPAHLTIINPKLNSLYPTPEDGKLDRANFYKTFIEPWIGKDVHDHWIFRSPITKVPVRFYPSELKVKEYANKDIRDMLWEMQTGKKFYSSSNECKNEFCVNPDHYIAKARYEGNSE